MKQSRDTNKTEVYGLRITEEAKQKLEEKARSEYLDLQDYIRQQLYKLINYMPSEKEEK